MDRHRPEINRYTPPHRKDRPIHAWETEPQPIVHAWETAPKTDRNTRHRKPKPNKKQSELPCQVSGSPVFRQNNKESDTNEEEEELNPYLPIPRKPQRQSSPCSQGKPRIGNDHQRGRSKDDKQRREQDAYEASVHNFFDRAQSKPHSQPRGTQNEQLNPYLPSNPHRRTSPSPPKPHKGTDYARGRSKDSPEKQKHQDAYKASVHTVVDRPKAHNQLNHQNEELNPYIPSGPQPTASRPTRPVSLSQKCRDQEASSPDIPTHQIERPSNKGNGNESEEVGENERMEMNKSCSPRKLCVDQESIGRANHIERPSNEGNGNESGEVLNDSMEPKQTSRNHSKVTNWADLDTDFDYNDVPIWE
ncbi:uncharacterized protein SPPG_01714 [Spizellomyces punctatus DAOM BR117]|uniref:Uncharacterized protein n=1 Tax=Spizellomyces punctatus (strain DAOM BR117) TaxID=645134 RepID=A0A0L0HNV7_SPIPD|nr:uncharacterized protein SPPG_01714 [Spizellomyces punctatus DAOM BR117]KND02625.1 hypothetical protein SPPG_01714 [Spizellomyces punctatus DAOM BR117]|eukprot:XP_016610664.1 hypothetical protein SPPG_01714 [Spizellomyces punctatus DAOM BR117]